MIIIVSIISGILSGMGIGGGAIFIILSTMLLNFEQKYAQTLNLILFIAVGITATISNIKDKKIDFNLFKKMLPLLVIGSFLGTKVIREIDSQNLRKYFLYFLVFIGIYEIITSVINIKKAKNKNNKKKGE